MTFVGKGCWIVSSMSLMLNMGNMIYCLSQRGKVLFYSSYLYIVLLLDKIINCMLVARQLKPIMKDSTRFLKANSKGGLVPQNILYIVSKGLYIGLIVPLLINISNSIPVAKQPSHL